MNMKTRKIIFAMLFFVLLGVLETPNCKVDAKSSFVQKLKVGKEYFGYDITNDGKKDTLIAKNSNGYDYEYNEFKVYVNGKKALTITFSFYTDSTVFKIIRLSNGENYLFIHLGSDNNDGPADLYRYKNGRLKKEVNLLSFNENDVMGFHSYADVKSVSGNKLVMKMNSMSYGLANVYFESIYQYSSGKLKLKSNTHKIYGYYSKSKYGKNWLTTARNMQVYKDKNVKKQSFVLKKGVQAKVLKCCIFRNKVSYYIRTKEGRQGWFLSPKTTKQPFKEIMYAG